MVTMPLIEVVMPTYNGVFYIEQQIASIYNQTLKPIRLLIRDDFSTDGSLELLYSLSETYGSWLKIFSSDSNLGCTASIDLLLQATTAPYIALADQDDVWLPDKLMHLYSSICEYEATFGSSVPFLAHTDLYLVDENLKSLGTTFMQKQALNSNYTSSDMISLTNIVTGCTVLLNRSHLDIALPIPPSVIIHDWWLALVASFFGKIVYVPCISILYRQHASNLIGASGLGFNYWLSRFIAWLIKPSSGGHTFDAIRQIETFNNRYDTQISHLPTLIRLSRISRLYYLYCLDSSELPRKHGPLRTCALYFWLLRL